MAAALPILSLSSTVRASSVDTGNRLPYNPHRTYPKKPEALTAASSSTLTTTVDKNAAKKSISELLKRDSSETGREVLDETYLGYETWLPTPPQAGKPRSVFSPASLAYIGDCIYEAMTIGFEDVQKMSSFWIEILELFFALGLDRKVIQLYARRHFLFPPLNIEEYNDRVMAVVRCEAQDAMLRKLMKDDFLSQEERGVLRWGKNIGSSKTKTKKRAGVAVYNRASSLETLVGYLYLTNVQRLDEIMGRIGFSTDSSSPSEQEKSNLISTLPKEHQGVTRRKKSVPLSRDAITSE